MKKLSNQFEGENHKKLKFNNSHDDFQISSHFKGLKFYDNLSLSLMQCNQSQISLIRKHLEDLTQLKGLHISINFQQKDQSKSIQDIFKPLKSFLNLKVLKVEIDSSEMLVQIAKVFHSESQLETLVLAIPSINEMKKNEITSIQQAFQNLKCLKELRLKVKVDDIKSEQNFNEVLGLINSLQNLTSLAFDLSTSFRNPKSSELVWSLNNLTRLQELEIISDQDCELQVVRFSEQIKSLESLTKIILQVKVLNKDNSLNKFFNSILQLKNLSELAICLELMTPGISISIGEDVSEEINLRTFSLNIKRQFGNHYRGILNFRKKITNIKMLENVYLDLSNFILSDESHQVLSKWMNEWTQLKDLSFDYGNLFDIKQSLQMQISLRDFFFRAQSIIHLKINLHQDQNQEGTDLLCGLAWLQNLQTLYCKNLLNKNNQNVQKQYLECFQKLSNLREINFGWIGSSDEILCIGNSLPFLSGLEILKICFGRISEYQHLEVISRNLKELTNLKCLSLKQGAFCSFEINTNEIQGMFSSIQTLTSLRQLDFRFKISKNSQNNYEKLLSNLLERVSQLNELTLKRSENPQTERIIYRKSKRLIHFQDYF